MFHFTRVGGVGGLEMDKKDFMKEGYWNSGRRYPTLSRPIFSMTQVINKKEEQEPVRDLTSYNLMGFPLPSLPFTTAVK